MIKKILNNLTAFAVDETDLMQILVGKYYIVECNDESNWLGAKLAAMFYMYYCKS